jgi:hypothetical protein
MKGKKSGTSAKVARVFLRKNRRKNMVSFAINGLGISGGRRRRGRREGKPETGDRKPETGAEDIGNRRREIEDRNSSIPPQMRKLIEVGRDRWARRGQ